MAIRGPNRPPDFSRWSRNTDEERKGETQQRPTEKKPAPARERPDQFERDDQKEQRPETD